MTLFFPDLVYFEDPVGMAFWATGHYYEHNAMLAIAQANQTYVPDYDLLTWDPESRERQRDWLEGHGKVHDALRQLTGVTGPDYADVNFADKRQFDDWMAFHAQEHASLRQVLGLS